MSAARFGRAPSRRPSKPRSISPTELAPRGSIAWIPHSYIPKKARSDRGSIVPSWTNVKAGEQTESEGATGRMDPAGKGCPHEWATTRFDLRRSPWRANSRCTLPSLPIRPSSPIRSNASSATRPRGEASPHEAEAANASAIAGMSEPKGRRSKAAWSFRIRGNPGDP